jgi:hypothetical protein
MAFGKLGAMGRGMGHLGSLGNARYSPEALAIFASFTTPPTAARKQIINNCVVALISTGVWTMLDTLYFVAAADSQAARINWKNPSSFTLAFTNSPTFTTDRGIQGDGATSFALASGYNPSTAGLNYSLNSAAAGLYVRQAATINSAIDLYMDSTVRFQRAGTGLAYLTRINSASGNSYTYGTATGHFTERRTAAGTSQMFRNGSQVDTAAAASSALPTTFRLLSATGFSFSDAQISMAYSAGGLSDQNISDLNSAVVAYLTAVGAI